MPSMNIVIIGAGDIGRHIAKVLSEQQSNVILVDQDVSKLEQTAQECDIATRLGLATDWQLLDDLLELSPDYLISVTNDDEANLSAALIAKNLGYPRTIARVKNHRYLNRIRLDFGRMFGVDHLIGPELLVAEDIFKYISSPGSLAMETFAHGAVRLRTLVIPPKWRKGGKRLHELDLPKGMMVGLIRRQNPAKIHTKGAASHQVIFPHGHDVIFAGDEVTVIGETDVINDVHLLFGTEHKEVKSVVIVGGSTTAIVLSKILDQRGIHVRIVEKDYKKCCLLAEQLPHCTILHHDGEDIDFLRSEKIDRADVLVACTSKDDVNLLVSSLAKEAGCHNVVLMLNNVRYSPLLDHLGIKHTVSPGNSAANRIISLIRGHTVSSMASLYERQAEIVEITVSMDSKLVGIPISELGPQLPKDFLIAVIQNRGRIIIAHGNHIISPGDTIIVVTNPAHIRELEKVF